MDIFDLVRWAGIALIIGAAMYLTFTKKRGQPGSSAPSMRDIKGGGALQGFAVDITQTAQTKGFDPVIGREEEIMRVTQILSRRTKNNVILAGPPGVGKTAIVEGLALKISQGDVPAVLQNKRILSLRVTELLAGTKYRGEFEQRIKRVVEEIRTSERSIILFVDEIHTVMQTKGAEGSVNLSDILKPALARGELQLIGATTSEEYDTYIAPDESWARRFQKVLIDEPSVEEAIAILTGIKENYESFHNVTYTPEAITAAVRLSKEYIDNRRLPDKAIDIIDEAGAMVTVQEGEAHPEAAGVLHNAGKNASEKHGKKKATPVVDIDDIKSVVADWADVAVEEIH